MKPLRRLARNSKSYYNYNLYPLEWIDEDQNGDYILGNYRLHKNGKRCLVNWFEYGRRTAEQTSPMRLEFSNVEDAIKWIKLPWEKAYKVFLRCQGNKSVKLKDCR